MADIKLKSPWVIDGVVRQPAEGVITVPDDAAENVPPEVLEEDEDGEDDTGANAAPKSGRRAAAAKQE